ncbi:MAG: AtpZ/AtpI family protein [Pseudomonadota bacterium]
MHKTMLPPTSEGTSERVCMASGSKNRFPENNGTGSVSQNNLDERRVSLEAKIAAKVKDEDKKLEADSAATGPGVAKAFKLSSEFIAGVVAGAGLGFLIDNFAGTTPWGMIIFLLLGFAAGVLNVLRSAGLVAQANYAKPPEERGEK